MCAFTPPHPLSSAQSPSFASHCPLRPFPTTCNPRHISVHPRYSRYAPITNQPLAHYSASPSPSPCNVPRSTAQPSETPVSTTKSQDASKRRRGRPRKTLPTEQPPPPQPNSVMQQGKKLEAISAMSKRRGGPRKKPLDKNDASLRVDERRGEGQGETKPMPRMGQRRSTRDAPDAKSAADEKYGAHDGKLSGEAVDVGDAVVAKVGNSRIRTPGGRAGKQERRRVSETEQDERRMAEGGVQVGWNHGKGGDGAFSGDNASTDERAETQVENMAEGLEHESWKSSEQECRGERAKSDEGELESEREALQGDAALDENTAYEKVVEIGGRAGTKRTQRQWRDKEGLAFARRELLGGDTDFESKEDIAFGSTVGDVSATGKVTENFTAGKEMKRRLKRRQGQGKQESVEKETACEGKKANDEELVTSASVPLEKDASTIETEEHARGAPREMRRRRRRGGVAQELRDRGSKCEGEESDKDGGDGKNIAMPDESSAVAKAMDVEAVSIKADSPRLVSRTRTGRETVEREVSEYAGEDKGNTRKTLNDTTSANQSGTLGAAKDSGQLPMKGRQKQGARPKKLKQAKEGEVKTNVQVDGGAMKLSEGVRSRRHMKPRDKNAMSRTADVTTNDDETENDGPMSGLQKRGKAKKLAQGSTTVEMTSRTRSDKDGKPPDVQPSRRSGRTQGLRTKNERGNKVVHALDIEGNLLADVSLVPMPSPVEGKKEMTEARKVEKSVTEKERASAVSNIMIDKDDRLLVDEGEIDILESSRLNDGNPPTVRKDENSDESVVTGQFDEPLDRNEETIRSVPKPEARDAVKQAASATGTQAETEMQSTEAERKRRTAASFRRAEALVETGTIYGNGRYGHCFSCGESIVIPGVAQFFCKNCGWMRRAVEIKTVAPGHHD